MILHPDTLYFVKQLNSEYEELFILRLKTTIDNAEIMRDSTSLSDCRLISL